MKVQCILIPNSPSGDLRQESSRLTIGSIYSVASIYAEPSRSTLLQIVSGDRGSLVWVDSSSFVTVNGKLPARWVAEIDSEGGLTLAPAAWLAEGFWEDYFNGVRESIETVEAELAAMY